MLFSFRSTFGRPRLRPIRRQKLEARCQNRKEQSRPLPVGEEQGGWGHGVITSPLRWRDKPSAVNLTPYSNVWRRANALLYIRKCPSHPVPLPLEGRVGEG